MAITDKEQGVWELDEVYNKINQGGIWSYTGAGELYGWGLNNNGYVGDNSNVNRSSPTQIPGTTWSELSNSHLYRNVSIAFKTNGTLWSWGYNGFGQVGDNSRTNRSSPTQIPGTWSAGAAIRNAVLATKTDGTAWVWGNNEYGVLGLNKANDVDKKSSPTQLGTDTTWGKSREKLGAGFYATFAIKANGTLWSWGYNGDGQLAQNNKTTYSSPMQIGTDTTWDKLCDNAWNYMGALKTDGTLWTWGDGEYGQLGLNKGGDPSPRRQSSPCQVLGSWSNAVFGNLGGLGVKTDGTLWVWGKNDEGELGLNQGPSQLARVSSPTQIGTDTTWSASLAGGNLETWAAVKTDGTLWTWGNGGNQGQLGLNQQASTPRRSSPTQIPGTSWDKLSGGQVFHSTQIL